MNSSEKIPPRARPPKEGHHLLPKNRKRADLLLFESGLASSRSRAEALIRSGVIFHGTQRIDKPGDLLPATTVLTLKGTDHPFVSRGGLKLAHALTCFKIEVKDKIALDVGASTGGFTDVLLQNGAAKVYAVDVGYGQLAEKLRRDTRVIVHERTNARYLTEEMIGEKPDLIVCDASFISLKTVLPAALSFCREGAVLLALIKPQFEVGRDKVGKKGVVRDEALHLEVCEDIKNWLSIKEGWQIIGLTESPITGPEGNKEFLIAACKNSG